MCLRMEAYSESACDSVASDAAERHVRTVKGDQSEGVSVPDTAVDRRLRKLESDLAAQRQEIRQLNADADHWRHRANAMVAEQCQIPFPMVALFVQHHQCLFYA